jgi:nucleotide-binding universal stress UspA family protein
MYKTVLCAIGLGSRERAEHLLDTSKGLLANDGILHVVHVVERFASFTMKAPDDATIAVIGDAEQKLRALCKQLSIPGLVHVRTDRAAETILEVAAEVEADLIVMAAHRADVLDHIFGSTVDHVAHHARCSIHIDRISQTAISGAKR